MQRVFTPPPGCWCEGLHRAAGSWPLPGRSHCWGRPPRIGARPLPAARLPPWRHTAGGSGQHCDKEHTCGYHVSSIASVCTFVQKRPPHARPFEEHAQRGSTRTIASRLHQSCGTSPRAGARLLRGNAKCCNGQVQAARLQAGSGHHAASFGHPWVEHSTLLARQASCSPPHLEPSSSGHPKAAPALLASRFRAQPFLTPFSDFLFFTPSCFSFQFYFWRALNEGKREEGGTRELLREKTLNLKPQVVKLRGGRLTAIVARTSTE